MHVAPAVSPLLEQAKTQLTVPQATEQSSISRLARCDARLATFPPQTSGSGIVFEVAGRTLYSASRLCMYLDLFGNFPLLPLPPLDSGRCRLSDAVAS